MAPKIIHDWKKIHEDFTTGTCTLKDLAHRHGVKYRTIADKSSKEKWFEQRDSVQRQAQKAVTEEILRRSEEQNAKMDELICKDGEAHMKRSLQTGDRLYTLFQAAVTAMQHGDLKAMRSAVDTWVTLDNQMRKIHNIDDNADKPLVNINVLAALPSREEREAAKARTVEA